MEQLTNGMQNQRQEMKRLQWIGVCGKNIAINLISTIFVLLE